MTTELPESISELSRIFSARGVLLYLVGGFVRNIVLGLPGGDFDVCSGARPEEAAAIAREAGLEVTEKALQLGTIEIRMHTGGAKHVFEHTTFRRDYYPSGGMHRPSRVEFTDDIVEDARRRDFTAGALYLNLQTGDLLDPTGKGHDDILNKVLRTAADDPDETIRDDGLRIMRMARFAAELGFSVAPDLLASARRYASLLADISAERKREELVKILLADVKYPALGLAQAPFYGLELLLQTGALPFVLPRLCAGVGVAQSSQYHSYDVLSHGMHACASAPPDIVLRLAALLHDIGKPSALNKNGNMYDHDKLGETLAREELDALRFDNKTKIAVLSLIRYHMFDLEGKAKPKTIRKRAIQLGKVTFERLIALRRADLTGSGKPGFDSSSADHWQAELNRMIEMNVPWRIQDLAVTGTEISEILHIPPSPAIGRILAQLHQECVASPALNDPQLLKKRIKMLSGRAQLQ